MDVFLPKDAQKKQNPEKKKSPPVPTPEQGKHKRPTLGELGTPNGGTAPPKVDLPSTSRAEGAALTGKAGKRKTNEIDDLFATIKDKKDSVSSTAMKAAPAVADVSTVWYRWDGVAGKF